MAGPMDQALENSTSMITDCQKVQFENSWSDILTQISYIERDMVHGILNGKIIIKMLLDLVYISHIIFKAKVFLHPINDYIIFAKPLTRDALAQLQLITVDCNKK